MGMLLTDSQRKWVDMLKEAAKRKAPVQALRPQVKKRTAFVSRSQFALCRKTIQQSANWNRGITLSNLNKHYKNLFTMVFCHLLIFFNINKYKFENISSKILIFFAPWTGTLDQSPTPSNIFLSRSAAREIAGFEYEIALEFVSRCKETCALTQ